MAKKKCRSSIGGQAVLEGVMMMGERSIATAVRDEKGNIQVESKHTKSIKEKSVLRRVPFVRGILNFGTSMYNGVGIMLRASSVFEGEAEPSKFEKWAAQKLKINVMSVIMGIAVILGIGLSIGLFFLLPQLITSGLKQIPGAASVHNAVFTLIEGVVRIFIFVAYILLTSIMKEIRRVYMYHGAEHKTISCYEHGLELTVENVQKQSTIHDRCGTTFMFLVMIVSILVFSVTTELINWAANIQLPDWSQFLIKLALLPLVAGVSYEILKFLAKFDNWFVRIIKAPGLLLQKVTTKQPTDDMVEVAITAFNRVLEMDANPDMATTQFDTKVMLTKARKELEAKLVNIDGGVVDLEWIMVEVLGVKRSELGDISHIRSTQLNKITAMVEQRVAGLPLQQILGNTNFYGNDIIVTADVLSPRPETEYLVEQAVMIIKQNSLIKVHDLCTGSGAIAITIKLQCPNCEVSASDISTEALAIASANCERNNADVKLIESDMFSSMDSGYDMIISNPPYIPSAEIDSLDSVVRDHEPRLALDGGEDGLDYYRIIIRECVNRIKDKGFLLLEVGHDQANKVKELMESSYTNIRFAKDLEGIDRIVIAEVGNNV